MYPIAPKQSLVATAPLASMESAAISAPAADAMTFLITFAKVEIGPLGKVPPLLLR